MLDSNELVAEARQRSPKAAGRPTGPRRFDGKLLDVRGAAELLGVSQKVIRARVHRHLLPFRRFGGRIVFIRDELDQFIAALPGVTLEEARENLAIRSGHVVMR